MITRFGLAALLIAITSASCAGKGGTGGGNPSAPGLIDLQVELGSANLSTVSSVEICSSKVTLVSSSGESSSHDMEFRQVSVGGSTQSLGTISAREGSYARADLEISPACAASWSASVTNSQGSFQSSRAITVLFTGGFSLSRSTKALQLAAQPIVDQLVPISSSAELENVLTTTPGSTVAVENFSWTGGAGNLLWSDASNWRGGAVPGASDVAVFDGGCGLACDATIDIAASVRGFEMRSTYPGTITQAGANVLSVGESGFVQQSGTFISGSGGIPIAGAMSVLGGTFNGPTSKLPGIQLKPDLADGGGTYRIFQVGAGANFTSDPGDLRFEPTWGAAPPTIEVIDQGATILGGLEFRGSDRTGSDTIATYMVNAPGEILVKSGLKVARSGATGQIRVNGSGINLQGNSRTEAGAAGGTLSLVLSDQLGWNSDIFITTGSFFEGTLTIRRSGGGEVQLETSVALPGDLVIEQGTLNMQGFTLNITGNLTNDGVINRNGGALIYGSLSGSGTINP